ncbi:helix-turn-helix domain-containing protein [Methylobacterium sp.]|uniref:helix-turn-helix domain-containing protein n=1 Tax=Methylobacterium sp. TaxID=409 RepID=UPI0025F1116E|nr:helix-turn-helix domain-containing protein [Methylobacterium sp.]MBY0256060.1 XRE family transcriptional regulator [Methylobacterium sp.]
MMDIRPIRTDQDLTWAIDAIRPYFEHPPAAGSPEADRFDVLATLIQAYEDTEHTIEPVDPVDCLNYAIQNLGHSQGELAELLGSRSRASEILNRRRALTLEQIRLIHAAWHLPLTVLARAYPLAQDAA